MIAVAFITLNFIFFLTANKRVCMQGKLWSIYDKNVACKTSKYHHIIFF